MDKMKIMGFHQPPSTIFFDDPHTKTTPLISPHIHLKMRKGCRNDYIEAIGAVYWAKMLLKKNKTFGRRGIITKQIYQGNRRIKKLFKKKKVIRKNA